MNGRYNLLDDNGRAVAAGSYEAIYAAARLLFDDPRPHLVNRFEHQVMDSMSKRVAEDIDRQVFGRLSIRT